MYLSPEQQRQMVEQLAPVFKKLIYAIAAIQHIQLHLAKPIPKYPSGTGSAPTEFAMIGGNGPEVVELSTYPGKLFIPRLSLHEPKHHRMTYNGHIIRTSHQMATGLHSYEYYLPNGDFGGSSSFIFDSPEAAINRAKELIDLNHDQSI